MIKSRSLHIFALCVFLANAITAPQPAAAQKQIHYSISSGTGFFISMNGFLITNAHVVNGCDRAVIKGDMKRTVADIVAVDVDKDLALLRTSIMPQFAAPLRDNISDLKAGDNALVMGYPGNHAITGDYALADTQILDVTGPLGNPDTIQFGDAAQKGNSGGPLLDSSGNVIGVVMGKSEVYRVDPRTQEKSNYRRSDVAISIKVLKEFLQAHGVYARDLVSSLNLTRERIVDRAQYYVVNVQCAPVAANEDPRLRDIIIKDLTREPTQDDYGTPPEEPAPAMPQVLQPISRDSMVIYDKQRDEQQR